MRSRRGEVRAAALAAAAVSLALHARAAVAADAEAEPIRVRFAAPAGCPSEAAFLEQIRQRTAKARAASPGEAARTFSVRLAQEGRLIHGRLAIEEPFARTDIREVTGERCGEVVSALALITALVVDPQASTAPPASLPPSPLPVVWLPPGSEGGAPADPGGADARPPRIELPPNHPAPYFIAPSFAGPDVAPLPVIPLPRVDDATGWRFTVGLEGVAASAIGPRLALGTALFVEAARTDEGAFAPSLRLTGLEVDSGFVKIPPVLTRFRLRAGRAELCPVRLEIRTTASFVPCGSFEAGTLFADGWGSAAPGSSLRPWIAPGITARVRLVLADIVELQVAGGGAFPLVRDTYFVAPSIDVHAVPATTTWLSAGVGVRFF